MDTLKVYLTQDQYLTDAKGIIRLNGAVLGEVTVQAKRGQTPQGFSFTGNWGPGPHVLNIEFTNNAYGGSADKNRNLIVNGYEFNGARTDTNVVFGNNGARDFPIAAPTAPAPNPVGSDFRPLIEALKVEMAASFRAVLKGQSQIVDGQTALAELMALGKPATVPTPPATPKPPTAPLGNPNEFADMAVTPGVPMMAVAGRHLKAKHFEPADCPLIIQGAGMRQTTFFGRGGAGSGNRLAWGKAFVHAKGTVIVRDVGFEDCGRHDGKSDGETSVYVEDASDDARVELVRCALDWNENGLFVPNPPQGARISAVVDSCVFGRTGPNGADDGLSHDLYVSGKSLTVRDSIFVGNAKGNIIKSRSATILIERNWVGRSNGRWIDAPCASTLVSRDNKYVTLPGAESANALGLYDEADGRHPGGGTFRFENDEFYFSRENGEVIWLPDARTIATFDACKVFWIGPKGSKPPSVELRGPGRVLGLDLTMGEHNRVDAAPPMPADPIAAAP